ncbi:serine hydrolase domain-containing protein [Maribacter thermophilus]|uniref:serine hydrolase domain-containing protein n=1 Tax=Maribacter thermophilus TaxID=1197874 RepID=UPI0012F79398|nr:serine hydrolase domain-containing protein [Maribacter thermophilus]
MAAIKANYMRILCILFVLSLFSCKNENKENDTKKSEFTDLQIKLDSLYNSYFDKNSPGAAILVLYDNKKVVNKGYGLRNLETKEPITPSTNLRSGSMAKQFTCLGLLKLMEEGKLSLTDTIYQYYPYPIFKNVTIEQFISHTSGIEDADWIIENSTKNSSEYVRNEDLIEWYANNNVIRFAPGTAFEYNNGTYVTLAQIIEKVSGMRYEDYIKKHVFEKAGMSRTQFIDDADSSKIPEYAYRYQRDSLGQWQSVEGHPMDEVTGAGGVYFSLDDYARYIVNHRNKTIVKSESNELIFKPISMNIELHSEDLKILKGTESSYAMGWEITDSMALSAGLWFGTQSFVIYERKRPLTIVMLANNDDFFKNRLVDKTYSIVNDYFNKAAKNVYK